MFQGRKIKNEYFFRLWFPMKKLNAKTKKKKKETSRSLTTYDFASIKSKQKKIFFKQSTGKRQLFREHCKVLSSVEKSYQ